jgi:hypothetical protein
MRYEHVDQTTDAEVREALAEAAHAAGATPSGRSTT